MGSPQLPNLLTARYSRSITSACLAWTYPKSSQSTQMHFETMDYAWCFQATIAANSCVDYTFANWTGSLSSKQQWSHEKGQRKQTKLYPLFRLCAVHQRYCVCVTKQKRKEKVQILFWRIYV